MKEYTFYYKRHGPKHPERWTERWTLRDCCDCSGCTGRVVSQASTEEEAQQRLTEYQRKNITGVSTAPKEKTNED